MYDQCVMPDQPATQRLWLKRNYTVWRQCEQPDHCTKMYESTSDRTKRFSTTVYKRINVVHVLSEYKLYEKYPCMLQHAQHIFFVSVHFKKNNAYHTKISKLECQSYFFGMMKCRSAQSSLREFWSGVPVISIRWLVSKLMSVLYSNESSFFSRWASSTPSTAQLMLCRNDCKSRQQQQVSRYILRTSWHTYKFSFSN